MLGGATSTRSSRNTTILARVVPSSSSSTGTATCVDTPMRRPRRSSCSARANGTSGERSARPSCWTRSAQLGCPPCAVSSSCGLADPAQIRPVTIDRVGWRRRRIILGSRTRPAVAARGSGPGGPPLHLGAQGCIPASVVVSLRMARERHGGAVAARPGPEGPRPAGNAPAGSHQGPAGLRSPAGATLASSTTRKRGQRVAGGAP